MHAENNTICAPLDKLVLPEPEAAAVLGVSVRTLRRRRAQPGHPYNALLILPDRPNRYTRDSVLAAQQAEELRAQKMTEL